MEIQNPKSKSQGCAVRVLGVSGVCLIAMLAAIAVPNYLTRQHYSKIRQAKSDMGSIATALEAYNIDNKTYPTNLSPSLTSPFSYLNNIATDPFSTPSAMEYQYFTWSTSERDEKRNTKWLLRGIGPDTSYEVFQKEILLGMPEDQRLEFIDLTYDETNGAISRGDIFYFMDEVQTK